MTETISQTFLKDHALKIERCVGTFEGPGGEVCRVPERFPSLVLETPCRVDQGGPVLLHRRLENVIFRLREISSSFGCLVCQRVWCKQLPGLSGGNRCPVCLSGCVLRIHTMYSIHIWCLVCQGVSCEEFIWFVRMRFAGEIW